VSDCGRANTLTSNVKYTHIFGLAISSARYKFILLFSCVATLVSLPTHSIYSNKYAPANHIEIFIALTGVLLSTLLVSSHLHDIRRKYMMELAGLTSITAPLIVFWFGVTVKSNVNVKWMMESIDLYSAFSALLACIITAAIEETVLGAGRFIL
jgi:hypothetical protein